MYTYPSRSLPNASDPPLSQFWFNSGFTHIFFASP